MKRIFILIALTLLIACDKDDASDFTCLCADYFPLETGNIWYYSNKTREVFGTKTFNGKTYWEVEEFYNNVLLSPYLVYYRKTKDGKVYRLNPEKTNEDLIFDYHTGHNQSWYYQEDDNNKWKVTTASNYQTHQIGESEIINCRQYDYDLVEAVDDEHTKVLAPGLGILIERSYAWGNGDTLKSAVINGVEIKLKD